MSLDRINAPVAKGTEKIDFRFPEEKKLDNGSTCFYYNDDESEVVKIDFWFDAGLANATKNIQAIFTNDLIASGTSKWSQKEIADKIDFYGAYFEQSQNYDSAILTVFTLRKYAEDVLRIIAEVLKDCSFPEDELNKHVAIKRQKFLIDGEKVGVMARRAFNPQLFGSQHPYGKETVLKDYDEISRDDLMSFYNQNYVQPKILASGKVDDQLLKAINDLFGSSSQEYAINTSGDYEVHPGDRSIYLERKDALQSAIRVGRVLFNRSHPDFGEMQVLNTVLGGYFGSRLMSNLREDKGFTYGVGAGLSPLIHDGIFYISTEVGADVTNQAETEIFNELRQLREELVPENELHTVKSYMMGQILRSTDGVFSRMERFKMLHQFGQSEQDFQSMISKIQNVTPQRLQELANKWYREEDMFVVVAGRR